MHGRGFNYPLQKIYFSGAVTRRSRNLNPPPIRDTPSLRLKRLLAVSKLKCMPDKYTEIEKEAIEDIYGKEIIDAIIGDIPE